MDRVIVFDTTLRDGEQSPGCSMTTPEKIRVARQLQQMKVDVIEAGFPIASPGDFEAVKAIAEKIRKASVAGLARALKRDIDAVVEALGEHPRRRIHVFLATSQIHRKYKLKKARSEILSQAVEMVKYARRFSEDVEFSPEDASRTEPDFLAKVVEAVIDAGAGTVNIPDTVGYSVPSEFGALIAYLFGKVDSIDRAVISVHCHNDLGLAVANSLAAVKAGARQVECTINGIGERAGNCALEEVVMALHTRKDVYGPATGILTRQLVPASRLLSAITGVDVQRNKAVVGENAFAHEAGVHQDGLLKERSTYEIMRPEDVGWERAHLVLGKHSGRHAFKKRVEELGYSLDQKQLEHAFVHFKELSDKKKTVWDEDIEAILREEDAAAPEVFTLDSFHTSSGTTTVPTATVAVSKHGSEQVLDAATGDGPIDALYQAVDRITKMKGTLKDYSIRAVTSGKDAVGEVRLEVESRGMRASGRASSPDIIEASAKAYMNAINKLVVRYNRENGANGSAKTRAKKRHPAKKTRRRTGASKRA